MLSLLLPLAWPVRERMRVITPFHRWANGGTVRRKLFPKGTVWSRGDWPWNPGLQSFAVTGLWFFSPGLPSLGGGGWGTLSGLKGPSLLLSADKGQSTETRDSGLSPSAQL